MNDEEYKKMIDEEVGISEEGKEENDTEKKKGSSNLIANISRYIVGGLFSAVAVITLVIFLDLGDVISLDLFPSEETTTTEQKLNEKDFVNERLKELDKQFIKVPHTSTWIPVAKVEVIESGLDSNPIIRFTDFEGRDYDQLYDKCIIHPYNSDWISICFSDSLDPDSVYSLQIGEDTNEEILSRIKKSVTTIAQYDEPRTDKEENDG